MYHFFLEIGGSSNNYTTELPEDHNTWEDF